MTAIRVRQRRAAAAGRPASLNLVSLMDIFTILVFFLMVNSSEVEVLETTSAIKLPDSVAEQRPEERVSIQVSADDLIVQGRRVASINEIMDNDELVIEGLAEELRHQANRRKPALPDPAGFEGAVTIMGDRALPYELLKRVMFTCQQAEFTRIALAVNRVSEAEA
ncbi:MAG: ExbD/TolR family protein [Pseudomonadota bacterium]